MVSFTPSRERKLLEKELICNSMVIYFGFALAAAYINQRTDAQQSMSLDDLSRSSSTTHTDNPSDPSSSGPGTRAASVPPMNDFGITFINTTPDPDRQPKIARHKRSTEDQEILTNPFVDPDNSEHLYRGGLGSLQNGAQEQETRK
jgi:hypothetical protein